MSTNEAIEAFTKLCKDGKFEEAGAKFWADDVVSREPAFTGEGAVTKGRHAVEQKGVKWAETTELHSCKVEGPFASGDQFVLRFEMEVTRKGQARQSMTEVGLYTMKDGKIIEESFFYGL